jgi:protein subunit release factor B
MERNESETRIRALEQTHLFDWSEVPSGRKRIKEQDAAMRKMQRELDEMKRNKREEKAASQSEVQKLKVGIRFFH